MNKQQFIEKYANFKNSHDKISPLIYATYKMSNMIYEFTAYGGSQNELAITFVKLIKQIQEEAKSAKIDTEIVYLNEYELKHITNKIQNANTMQDAVNYIYNLILSKDE